MAEINMYECASRLIKLWNTLEKRDKVSPRKRKAAFAESLELSRALYKALSEKEITIYVQKRVFMVEDGFMRVINTVDPLSHSVEINLPE